LYRFRVIARFSSTKHLPHDTIHSLHCQRTDISSTNYTSSQQNNSTIRQLQKRNRKWRGQSAITLGKTFEGNPMCCTVGRRACTRIHVYITYRVNVYKITL